MCAITQTDDRIFYLNSIELLATIFRGPDSSVWGAIVDVGLPQLVERAPDHLADLTATLQKLQDSLPPLSEKGEPFGDLETEYVRLFVAGQGGVVAPLYESCHLGEKKHVMGDSALAMQRRLGEAGLEVSLDSNEPADHLALELEYLYHQLSTAWTDEDAEREQTARTFASEIMLPWVARFQDALAQGNPPEPFLHTALYCVDLLESIGA